MRCTEKARYGLVLILILVRYWFGTGYHSLIPRPNYSHTGKDDSTHNKGFAKKSNNLRNIAPA
ncbi:hypothetical protein HanRHA438_Chr07g0300101 [Helianthus annuus]|nr:hypothetical protein HanRHA438_Chr07g0300101 [Helianthus annuus]